MSAIPTRLYLAHQLRKASYSRRIGLASYLAAAASTGWTEAGGMLLLAPDIQQELLYLPEVLHGKAAKQERLLRPLDWRVQWRMRGRIRK